MTPPPESRGEMAARVRALDWATTPLGDPAAWPQSLRTATRILLSSRFAMWMAWGPELTFFCNDAYRPTLGVKEAWALGAPADRVWAEIWKDIGPRIQRVLETGEATWDEDLLLFLERSGFPEETYHTFSYSPLADDDGRIAGMLCVVTEETDRVIGERRLATLASLSAALATAQVEDQVAEAVTGALGSNLKDLPFAAVYLFDEDGGAARRVSLTGLGAAEPGPPARLDAADPVWGAARALAGEGRFALEAPAGQVAAAALWGEPPRRMLVTAIPQQGSERPAGFLLAGLNPFRPLDQAYGDFIDLLARQVAAALANARAYEAERRRAEALAEIDQAKTLFFSNVSHEFRTPLTLMLGPLEEVLAGRGAPADVRANVEVAHRNGIRLLRLVNNLLDFSRIEAGRVRAKFQPTDLYAYLADLASSFRSATDRAGLTLEVAGAPLDQLVWVDRDMLEKIVLNLLSNAFKFTFEGGITVGLEPRGEAVAITVSDTGTGIPAEALPKLFDRFHRVEGARGRSFEGSGIGLALVSELVKLHGGAIAVESEPGAGSRFTISLPFGVAHLPQDQVVREASDAAPSQRARAFAEEALRWLPDGGEAATLSAASPPSARGPRVVLADDNADMRSYVARLLGEAGYVVEAFADGEGALDAIRRARPDLVLSDVMMPRLDGFGLLRAVRADPKLSDLPVVLLSARAGEEASVEGLAAGADDYLIKPFASRELLARVGANLALANARRLAATEAAARAEELQAVLDTAPVAVWFTADPDARTVWSNAFAERMMRMAPGANASLSPIAVGRPIHFQVLRGGHEAPPESLPIQRAARGEEVRDDEQEIVFDDGRRIIVLCNATPLRSPDGRVRGAIATAVDITDRKRAEEHRTLLIHELNHRVKNTLATVQSVARQTLTVHQDHDSFQKAFEARLVSLSRAHDVLTEQHWEGADLGEIVARVLGPYRNALRERFLVEGAPVRLAPKQALALAMALHELTTNAVKYGALSTDAGRVELEWRVVHAAGVPVLEVGWRERGGPRVGQPSRRGFGTRLLERGLAAELEGEVRVDYEPAGVVCRIRAPIAEPERTLNLISA